MFMIRPFCCAALLALVTAPAASASAPIYSTGGRSTPNYSPVRWSAYQNYRGSPGYNVPRRLEARRLPFPKYQTMPNWHH